MEPSGHGCDEVREGVNLDDACELYRHSKRAVSLTNGRPRGLPSFCTSKAHCLALAIGELIFREVRGAAGEQVKGAKCCARFGARLF